ncbi:Methyltransferase domain-containing protein [Paucidesulfovibrio gracilis DSM 16080]|uniref:Methyltransferase domain-containing protein n=1 Tax=Paucidesulfovibrio gracilis DSM 16080 TaxID=1121449 RepID=A0A1T4XZV2_9BACT|nr:class I SAM-dependent methyltransferase [Paucidesulfovibrio gracilis]SKA94738.1 Methyltransferase domain-containing protein [Paucidesulfovibrio gracilis DSM 16080]
MTQLTNDTLGSVLFELTWESDAARHTDRFVAQKINLWRDLLPGEVHSGIDGLHPGEEFCCRISVLPPKPSLIREHRLRDFHPERQQLPGLRPREGRFYPQGLLDNVLGVHPSNLRPFRVLETKDDSFVADRNHPMTCRDFALRLEVLEVRDKVAEMGGSCQEWMDQVLDGPGLQARRAGGAATDFWDGTPLTRPNEDPDEAFHRMARLVPHIDSMARQRLQTLHGQLLRPGMDVLDLMAGWQSHLPENLKLNSCTGLGMNQEEMDANPDITSGIVQDLNEQSTLPFADGSFDAVLCCLSVEYLVRPAEVMREAARVLRPGGVLCLSVSNRWHAPKVTNLWIQLHEFERLGFLSELILGTEAFRNLQTLSERGWSRPFDERDRYYPVLQNADPLYAAWAELA